VSKTFGARTILRGLDFEVDERARVGVIGPNGGGKSTMLRRWRAASTWTWATSPAAVSW
jgi:ATPase subunit of ABC transporter with duplicated ATPase domains